MLIKKFMQNDFFKRLKTKNNLQKLIATLVLTTSMSSCTVPNKLSTNKDDRLIPNLEQLIENDNLEEVLSQIHPLIMDGGLQKKETLEIIQKLIQENNTVETVEIDLSNYYGVSIVDALSQNGYDSSFEFRAKLAERFGIPHYKGLGWQNILLLQYSKGNVVIENQIVSNGVQTEVTKEITAIVSEEPNSELAQEIIVPELNLEETVQQEEKKVEQQTSSTFRPGHHGGSSNNNNNKPKPPVEELPTEPSEPPVEELPTEPSEPEPPVEELPTEPSETEPPVEELPTEPSETEPPIEELPTEPSEPEPPIEELPTEHDHKYSWTTDGIFDTGSCECGDIKQENHLHSEAPEDLEYKNPIQNKNGTHNLSASYPCDKCQKEVVLTKTEECPYEVSIEQIGINDIHIKNEDCPVCGHHKQKNETCTSDGIEKIIKVNAQVYEYENCTVCGDWTNRRYHINHIYGPWEERDEETHIRYCKCIEARETEKHDNVHNEIDSDNHIVNGFICEDCGYSRNTNPHKHGYRNMPLMEVLMNKDIYDNLESKSQEANPDKESTKYCSFYTVYCPESDCAIYKIYYDHNFVDGYCTRIGYCGGLKDPSYVEPIASLEEIEVATPSNATPSNASSMSKENAIIASKPKKKKLATPSNATASNATRNEEIEEEIPEDEMFEIELINDLNQEPTKEEVGYTVNPVEQAHQILRQNLLNQEKMLVAMYSEERRNAKSRTRKLV